MSRAMKTVVVWSSITLLLCVGSVASAAVQGAWTPVSMDGLLNPGTDKTVGAVIVYNGELYVGTDIAPSGQAKVYKFNGSSWAQVGTAGLDGATGANENRKISCFAIHNGVLYAGTYNATGGKIFRLSGGSWSMVYTAGGSDAEIAGMASDGTRLWAGGANGATTADVYYSDPTGSVWNIETMPGSFFKNAAVLSAYGEAGQVYIGTMNGIGAGKVWWHSGSPGVPTNWVDISDGTTMTGTCVINRLVKSGGTLYAAKSDAAASRILKYDGASAWSELAPGSFYPNEGTVDIAGGSLYAVSTNGSAVTVWKYTGSAWSVIQDNKFWDSNNDNGMPVVWNGDLYVATNNSGASGTEVWRQTSGYKLVFPAGSTADMFRLAAMPTDGGGATIVGIVDPQIGVYDTSQMRLGHWEHDTQTYDEYPPPPEDFAEAGDAFWALFRTGKTILWPGNTPASMVIQSLMQGWNQVGNPYTFPVSMSSTEVSDGATPTNMWGGGNTFTQQKFWVYQSGTYLSVDEPAIGYKLYPGQGGWIKMLSPSGDIRIKAIPIGWLPTNMVMSATPDGVKSSTSAAYERPPAPPGGFGSAGGGGGGGGGGCFISAGAE